MKIAIIGAGWYGCHLASVTDALGWSVDVFEKSGLIMSEASGHNQHRLHQGFHYARNFRTRVQSRDGYLRFIERYPSLSRTVEKNIYAVSSSESLLDFVTYKVIMSSTGLEFTEVVPSQFELQNCSGAMLTNERVLDVDNARRYFDKKLQKILRLNETVSEIHQSDRTITVNGGEYDYAIDATWGGMGKLRREVEFEATILLYYRSMNGEEAAVTLVDGPLSSMYPCGSGVIHTLSNVRHTPIKRFPSMNAAKQCLSEVTSGDILLKRNLMENEFIRYYPCFKDKFEFLGPQLSVKTKILGASDDRSCYIERDRRLFHVLSGKIDTVFYASDLILAEILGDLDKD